MTAASYVEAHLDRYLTELSAFARIPSVSSQGRAIDEAAAFIADALRQRGARVDLLPSSGHPIVAAEIGEGARTLLCYNHYDVQPAEPLDAWSSPPFEPQQRDGALFGRGIIDDKGEIVARLAALDALLERNGGRLPLKLKFLIEGEEEIGSPNLEPVLRRERERFAADACLWEAGTVDDLDRPLIWLGVRGLVYVTLGVRTLAHDAHSGWAHALPNAAWRLLRALETLKGTDERIRIAGFYDDVRDPTPAQEELLRAMPDEDEDYRREYAIESLVAGRGGYELRRAVFEPTCNICGLWSGSTGAGSKTITPATAFAKIDFRLVPDQDPDDILTKLRRHLDAHGFDDVEIAAEKAGRAACTDPSHPFVALAVAAAEFAHAKPAVVSPMVGGTGPAALVADVLGVPFVSLGCSYPGGRKHAPNENIRLRDFVRGAACIAQLAQSLA